VPKSRMRGAIPPLPNTPSWRGAQLKKARGQLYLYLLPFLVNGKGIPVPKHYPIKVHVGMKIELHEFFKFKH